MKELLEFLKKIGATVQFKNEEIIKINNKRFVINTSLLNSIYNRSRLVYVGTFLGRTKKDWEPSTILLEQVSKDEKTNKIWIDDDAAWLFVCGRDIFLERVVGSSPPIFEGSYYLIMNNNGCLGFVKVEFDEDRLILRNKFDIGDFLRREKIE
jgi:ribosome biogenesis protein Nip4